MGLSFIPLMIRKGLCPIKSDPVSGWIVATGVNTKQVLSQ
jgi:hypothetical protein